ncbi:MAG TPA: hypothetical protein PL023_04320 [Thiobacillus sp.]|nr:hypothetical protein [Thiobacillus sp.]
MDKDNFYVAIAKGAFEGLALGIAILLIGFGVLWLITALFT